MAVKADWYVLPGESVAASGTVTYRGGSSFEIRVLQNRIILASTTSNYVEILSMKEIYRVDLRQGENGWEIILRSTDYTHDNYALRVGTNWDWAHTIFKQIQCRL